jgi:hypothetical protein
VINSTLSSLRPVALVRGVIDRYLRYMEVRQSCG